METIPKNECTKIGFIQKPHGINGELIIKFDEQYYETLEESKTLFLDTEGLLVPFFIEDLRFRTGESAIIKLEWTGDEEQAQELSGLSVFVKNEQIRVDGSAFNIRMLEGFMLIDQCRNQIGKINAVRDFSGNIVLEVNYLGKDTIIPFNEDLLIDFDIHNKTIILDLPEGILDLDEE